MKKSNLLGKFFISMGKIMLLVFIAFSTVAFAQKNEKLIGKVKGQTLEGKWWWTLLQDDGSYYQFGWWGLQKAELMEEIKTLQGKKVVVQCTTTKGNDQKMIETISSIKLYDPNEVTAEVNKAEKKVAEKEKTKKKKDAGYTGKIKGQTIDGVWWWTLIGDDGVTYRFGWWALDKAGFKETIKSMQGKRYVVKGKVEVEDGANVFNEIFDISPETTN